MAVRYAIKFIIWIGIGCIYARVKARGAASEDIKSLSDNIYVKSHWVRDAIGVRRHRQALQ